MAHSIRESAQLSGEEWPLQVLPLGGPQGNAVGREHAVDGCGTAWGENPIWGPQGGLAGTDGNGRGKAVRRKENMTLDFM